MNRISFAWLVLKVKSARLAIFWERAIPFCGTMPCFKIDLTKIKWCRNSKARVGLLARRWLTMKVKMSLVLFLSLKKAKRLIAIRKGIREKLRELATARERENSQ